MTLSTPPNERLHATCVSVGSRGVLLMGPSGSGKSDLALRLMNRGAVLVADDQTVLRAENGRLIATVDDSIRGLLEIHGVGLVNYPIASNIRLHLAVSLVPVHEMEHIPHPAVYECMGVTIPRIIIHGFASSSPDKIYAALHALQHNLHAGFLPDSGMAGKS